MIEYNLMQLLQSNDTLDVSYSINFTTLKDDVVTVYSSSGAKPSQYEGVLTKLRYQIIVKSSDFDKATELAYNTYELLNGLENVIMPVELKTRVIVMRVYKIAAQHEPALLGVNNDGAMEYSLNFETQMIKV